MTIFMGDDAKSGAMARRASFVIPVRPGYAGPIRSDAVIEHHTAASAADGGHPTPRRAPMACADDIMTADMQGNA